MQLCPKLRGNWVTKGFDFSPSSCSSVLREITVNWRMEVKIPVCQKNNTSKKWNGWNNSSINCNYSHISHIWIKIDIESFLSGPSHRTLWSYDVTHPRVHDYPKYVIILITYISLIIINLRDFLKYTMIKLFFNILRQIRFIY